MLSNAMKSCHHESHVELLWCPGIQSIKPRPQRQRCYLAHKSKLTYEQKTTPTTLVRLWWERELKLPTKASESYQTLKLVSKSKQYTTQQNADKAENFSNARKSKTYTLVGTWGYLAKEQRNQILSPHQNAAMMHISSKCFELRHCSVRRVTIRTDRTIMHQLDNVLRIRLSPDWLPTTSTRVTAKYRGSSKKGLHNVHVDRPSTNP